MYKIIKSQFGECIRLEKENGLVSLIPIYENNSDYQAYLAWVAEGNTAEEWDLGGAE